MPVGRHRNIKISMKGNVAKPIAEAEVVAVMLAARTPEECAVARALATEHLRRFPGSERVKEVGEQLHMIADWKDAGT